MKWTAAVRALAVSAVTIATLLAAEQPPAAHANNGDTHITGVGLERTVDCNDATLFVNGTNNSINALGTCWAVTVAGSSNTIIVDTVINDITVYGWNQTVFFHNGAPLLWDRGRELGMVNTLYQVPA
ncbi:MAG: DUF3060 domain-containing protein [Mycobacteriaceae bacterium]|nr:DUF3060 domain-containing protein [Mycobacteriaceae bacterium]